MKTRVAIGLLSILSIPSACIAADATSTPGLSSTPTNAFSNWVGASTNLSIYDRMAPWGHSASSRVTMVVRAGTRPQLPRRLVEQLAEKDRERALERILNARSFTETYHVHLSETNSSARTK